MKTVTEKLKQAILEIIVKVYHKCYVGYLFITPLPAGGWDVGLGFDNDEKHIHIAAQLEFSDFLKYFESELRSRHWGDLHFYTGYKSDPLDERPYCGHPINHTCCDHGHSHVACVLELKKLDPILTHNSFKYVVNDDAYIQLTKEEIMNNHYRDNQYLITDDNRLYKASDFEFSYTPDDKNTIIAKHKISDDCFNINHELQELN